MTDNPNIIKEALQFAKMTVMLHTTSNAQTDGCIEQINAALALIERAPHVWCVFDEDMNICHAIEVGCMKAHAVAARLTEIEGHKFSAKPVLVIPLEQE